MVAACTFGCTVSRGALPKVSMVSTSEGFKMLRPGATARVCDGSIGAAFGMDGGADLLGTCVRRLLALDPEGDSVVNAQVEWTWRSIGLYGWQCVEVRGDVVRAAPAVVLPMPGGHQGHQGHQGH